MEFLIMRNMIVPAIFAFSLFAGAALSHDYKLGDLQIDHPWTRATPKGASVGAGYLKITNNGRESDRLIGGSFAASGRFEIHEMVMSGGTMQMRPLARGIEVKPGETVELKPGGLHLMFLDLKQPLVQGERIKGTLRFEKSGTQDVEFVVEAIGARSGHSGHGH
jgi:copper(I)-binding protein